MGRRVLEELRKALQPRIKELKFGLKIVRECPLSIAGIIIIIIFIGIAALAPVLAPPKDLGDPYQVPTTVTPLEPQPPTLAFQAAFPFISLGEHPLGTTPYAYDIYYGMIWGARTAFRVSLIIVGVTILIGTAVGLVAGYKGGKVDEVIMRIVDIFLTFPALVFALAIVGALGPSIETLMIAIIFVWWAPYARLLRGEILKVREQTYVEAAKVSGVKERVIMFKHVLPNAIYPIIILGSMDVGIVEIIYATLSFFGLGAPHGYAEWGWMVSLSRDWLMRPGCLHAILIPGLFIFFFCLAWNFLGDAFRDILDPRMRRWRRW